MKSSDLGMDRKCFCVERIDKYDKKWMGFGKEWTGADETFRMVGTKKNIYQEGFSSS